MNRDTAISRILAFVDAGADVESLLAENACDDSPDLFAGVVEAFGSWDAGVAATLVHLRAFYEAASQRDADASGGGTTEDDPRPERVVTPDQHRDLILLARSGQAFATSLDVLPPTPEPVLRSFPDGPGRRQTVDRVALGADDGGVLLLTSKGEAVAVDRRLLPAWDPDAVPRSLARYEGLTDEDAFVTACARRGLRADDRFYSVSLNGQIKATDTKDFKRIGADAMVAVLLRDGDALVDVYTGAHDARVCVASSHGKALVFDMDSVRSQGRRATGVRAIKLDAGAHVVGSFVVPEDGWLLLVTESGLIKRTKMVDYRPQGRDGGGLQSVRLGGDDTVACVGVARPHDDAFVVTSTGRFARFPLWDVPFGGRAAKGETLLDLDEGESIVQVLGVPAGEFETV